MRRAAFLDRDGVINIDRSYVHRWDDFEFVTGAMEAVLRLQAADYRPVIVTNQSGLARGYFTEQQYVELTRHMLRAFEDNGIHIAGVYHCPHHPQGRIAALSIECDCRKPGPGLILRAAAEHDLSLPHSLLVGDKSSDLRAAHAAGVGRAYLVHSDNAESGASCVLADGEFDSLADCVNAVLKRPEDWQRDDNPSS